MFEASLENFGGKDDETAGWARGGWIVQTAHEKGVTGKGEKNNRLME
jgi:hypothetical protein